MEKRTSTHLIQKIIIGLFLPMLILATGIRIALKVLDLGSKGTVVTVHTELPYTSVIAATVSLHVIDIQSWLADARGNFVAKFSLNAVESLFTSSTLNLGELILTLEGETSSGSYSGSSSITAIDR